MDLNFEIEFRDNNKINTADKCSKAPHGCSFREDKNRNLTQVWKEWKRIENPARSSQFHSPHSPHTSQAVSWLSFFSFFVSFFSLRCLRRKREVPKERRRRYRKLSLWFELYVVFRLHCAFWLLLLRLSIPLFAGDLTCHSALLLLFWIFDKTKAAQRWLKAYTFSLPM